MFKKIFPWVILFNWMPYPRRFALLGTRFVFFYYFYYKSYEDAVIQYYRSRLRQLDSDFKMSEVGLEIVRRREEAIRQGVVPTDQEYPNLKDLWAEK